MKKRVLFISTSNEGTIAKCAANLISLFKSNENIEVNSVILYKYGNGEDEMKESSYLIDRTKDINLNASYLEKIFWIRKQKKLFKPDFTISTQVATIILNILSGCTDKKIGILHAPKAQIKEKGLMYYLYIICAYYILFPFLSKCVCVSKEVSNDISKVYTIAKRKVQVIYNYHNLANIERLSNEIFEERYIQFLTKPYILYCGRLDSNKAPLRAIEAFSKIKNKNMNLLLIGPDPLGLWDKVKHDIPQNCISRIHYLGNQRNPYKFMANAEALLSTSYSEGLPGVFIEALSLGVPIITTNSSRGNWEILSCESEYTQNLDGIFVSNDGVITSNLSYIDKSFYEKDIDNLKLGIDYILSHKTNPRFNFSKLIESNQILSLYFQNL